MMTHRKRKTDIDAGWAWLVLAGVACGLLLQASLMYAGGVIYVALLDTFHDDYTKSSLVGSINTGLMCLAAPLAGMITNKFSSRVAIVVGGALATTGFTLSSFAPSVDVLIVTMGIIVVSSKQHSVELDKTSLVYSSICCGMIVALGFYFQRWRNLILSGCYVLVGVGMFTSAPFALYVIEIYGLRSTFLLMACITAQICVIGMICKPSSMEISFHKERHRDRRSQNLETVRLKRRSENVKVSNILTVSLLRNVPFICFLISTSSWNFSLSIGIMHLPYYVSGNGGNSDQIRLITTAFSVGHIVGRIFGCFGVNRGVKQALIWYIISLGLAGFITSMFPLYSQYPVGDYVFSITLGLFCGIPSSMVTVIATNFVGVSMLPEAYSFAYFFSGTGVTIGPVVAGYLYSLTGVYLYSFVLAGAVLLLGSIVSLISVCIRKEETPNSETGSQTLAEIESFMISQAPSETEGFLNGSETPNTIRS